MLGGNNVSDNKWEEALKEVDINGDGLIDLFEFRSIFKKMLVDSRQVI